MAKNSSGKEKAGSSKGGNGSADVDGTGGPLEVGLSPTALEAIAELVAKKLQAAASNPLRKQATTDTVTPDDAGKDNHARAHTSQSRSYTHTHAHTHIHKLTTNTHTPRRLSCVQGLEPTGLASVLLLAA